MKTNKKPKSDPQLHCVPFEDAVTKMRILAQDGMRVRFFKLVVISPKGSKLTMTFDPVKFAKESK